MENKINVDIDRPSKQILNDMSKLKEEFEKTKSLLVTLTHHLDSLENAYNNLNEEIKKRNGD
jgi:predicted  nucleic acid-binding Zn-ribbon protein|tara:strand:- start:533 stop:718 length:186 start_codon:yes stop_codon:yes gene_type:complete